MDAKTQHPSDRSECRPVQTGENLQTHPLLSDDSVTLNTHGRASNGSEQITEYLANPSGAVCLGRAINEAKARITEIKMALESLPRHQRNKITLAVGIAIDTAGGMRTLIATSEPNGYLRKPMRRATLWDDVIVKGIGHAEADMVKYCRGNGWPLLVIAASREICPECAEAIAQIGATVVTPLKKP